MQCIIQGETRTLDSGQTICRAHPETWEKVEIWNADVGERGSGGNFDESTYYSEMARLVESHIGDGHESPLL